MILIRDTSANFTATNPVLLKNQTGQESDTGLTKIGDGVTAWNAMDYDTPVKTAFEQVLSGLKYKVPSSFAVKTAVDAKEDPLTFTAPLQRTGDVITIDQATRTVDGYIPANDFNQFMNARNILLARQIY